LEGLLRASAAGLGEGKCGPYTVTCYNIKGEREETHAGENG